MPHMFRFRVLVLLLFFISFLQPALCLAEIDANDLKTLKDDVSDFSLKDQKFSLLIGTGLTAAAFLLDDEVKNRATHWKSDTNKALSDAGNFIGNPVTDFTASFILYAASEKDSRLETASFTAMESVFFSTGITEALSFSVGRKRPSENDGSTSFKPFSGNASFPSSHAASSMAFFNTFAKYYGSPFSYLCYTAFAATAFGRIYEDRHHLSDVIMGGTVGYVISSYLYERHRKKEVISFVPVFFATDKNIFVGFTKYF